MQPLDQSFQVKKAWIEMAIDNHLRIFTALLPHNVLFLYERERDTRNKQYKIQNTLGNTAQGRSAPPQYN